MNQPPLLEGLAFVLVVDTLNPPIESDDIGPAAQKAFSDEDGRHEAWLGGDDNLESINTIWGWAEPVLPGLDEEGS